ncbi:unnamed protein product [Polarella glacialis]|uniref:Uncharacterized protein n=1 Tax=Polarella glacialis TaxID=89957 RepID=A0A813KB89_POLGL|nr:unnamed protein product [Polarella glacialis]
MLSHLSSVGFEVTVKTRDTCQSKSTAAAVRQSVAGTSHMRPAVCRITCCQLICATQDPTPPIRICMVLPGINETNGEATRQHKVLQEVPEQLDSLLVPEVSDRLRGGVLIC